MRYFADTSFWLALLSRRDSFHKAAVQIRRDVGMQPIVTTDLVLWEVLNACSDGPLRNRAGALFDRCLADPQIETFWTGVDLLRAGVEMYKSRSDKSWSLTDCVSFLLMQQQELADALTSDHHFAQAGFTVLLK